MSSRNAEIPHPPFEPKGEILPFPSVERQQKIQRGHEVMKNIGIDPYAQSERAQTLIDSLGYEGARIAHKEYENNKRMYMREFVYDEPVSEAHEYYIDRGELYSDRVSHELTQVKKGIHPGEREGATIEGFEKFEELVANPENNIAIWYSPAGPGGQKPPFSNLFYESGRLYLSFKGEKNSTHNFDIKIQEENFPVAELLHYLTPDKSRDLFHYLTHPAASRETVVDFLKKLEGFQYHPAMAGDPAVYVARRHEPDYHIFSWQEIINEVKQQLMKKLTQPQLPANVLPFISREMIAEITMADSIEESFYAQMRHHMQATGKEELMLYGCSTTSVLKNIIANLSMRSIMNELRPTAASTLYGTMGRMRPSEIISLSDIKNNSSDVPDPSCVSCGACGHQGVEITKEGNWRCPECNRIGPKASGKAA